MIAIARYDLSQAVSFTYTSDEDGKEKDVVVIGGALKGLIMSTD